MPSAITLTVKSLAQSTSFFLATLQPLDYIYRGRVENTIGFGLKDSPPDFWITQEIPGVPSGAAHVAFPAASQRNVQDFFVAALKAGGKCHGEPLLRDPVSGYYSAAVIDFDGNSIEAVFRPDLLDEGYGSRPSSVSSVSSVKSKPAMSSNAPTMVSKASTVKAPTEVRSVAPSQAASRTSKAPTSVSKVDKQSQVSRSPSHVSKTPPSVSRSNTQEIVPHTQTVVQSNPSGQTVTTLISEARGAINVARELANHVRPALESVNSASNVRSATVQDLSSHKPSDTIVGTLLGVAAGAALHYAYTKATESDKPAHVVETRSYRPPVARTHTEPSFADERMYYYHDYQNTPIDHPYAIEPPQSDFSRQGPSPVGSQRYITMVDSDERLSSITPSTVRPRRKSSFSGVDVRSFASKSKASRDSRPVSRALEAPPSAYRAPTAITQVETDSKISGRSRSKSRMSSSRRSASTSSDSKASRRTSRQHSDEDLRSSARSHASRRTPSKPSSRAPSATPSERTVVPTKSSVGSKAPSRASSRTTIIRPEDRPLPPSRAGSAISASPTEYMSSHSKANRTVIGKMLERERTGGRSELTKSVVGKIEDSERLNVSSREVDPSDSVSQVSSVRSKRTSRR